MNDQLECNVLVMSHLKLIGPPKEEASDSEEQKNAKKDMQKIIPYRLYPSALGQELPPKLASNFPFVMLYRTEMHGMRCTRTIHTSAQADVDVSVPIADIEKKLPVESGLLRCMTIRT